MIRCKVFGARVAEWQPLGIRDVRAGSRRNALAPRGKLTRGATRVKPTTDLHGHAAPNACLDDPMQRLWRACGRMAAPDGINKRHSPLARPYSTRKPRCGQTPETLSTQ